MVNQEIGWIHNIWTKKTQFNLTKKPRLVRGFLKYVVVVKFISSQLFFKIS